jgi:DNA-binding MarR family transcriptional regulator
MAAPSMSKRRGRQLDEIAEALPQRASSLLKLFLARSTVQVSRTEASVLAALAQRPWRITELAARERVTQPAITLLVNRLEQRGWAERGTDPGDGRVVLVTLTPEGREALARLRAEYRALLHEEIATLPEEDVCTLARAIEILDGVIERLGGAEAR